MSPVWTITYNGIEQSCAQWGLTARPVIKTRDRSPTEVSFRMAGAAPENGVPFPFRAQVIIRQNRFYANGGPAGGGWGGGGYVFTGYQTTQPGDVDGKSQGVTLVFKDALWLMQNTTFQQLWTIFASGPVWTSRCVLFMDINGWVPNIYQSIQWQITQIINFAQACGINVAPGTIDYNLWYLNYYHCRAISIWDALLKCLEPVADAKVWIDGSQNPPLLHVRTRANLAALPNVGQSVSAGPVPVGAVPGPVTLPYKGVDSLGRKHVSSKSFTPRYDLVPPQVVLQYQINNTVNGKSCLNWTTDAYPQNSAGLPSQSVATAGQTPFALVCPIDLTGTTSVIETGRLDCQPLQVTAAQTGYSNGSPPDHAAKRAWWSAKRGGEQSHLLDYRVRFGANTLADATVVDDNGNPINLSQYPNRIVEGTYHGWMKTPSGAQVNAIRAHIKVSAQYAEYDVVGSTPAEGDTNGNKIRNAHAHDLHCHCTLTNAPAGNNSYLGQQITAYTETTVTGLAQNIFESRAILDYDGTHEIIDPGNVVGRVPSPGVPAPSPITPLPLIIGHWNLLNFTGGNTAWAAANMSISGTEIDLLNNHQRIEVGPSKHLQPQDWSAMLMYFRYRRVYQPSSVRATGQGDPNQSADMPQNTPDANTVPGLEVNQTQAFLAPDSASTGLQNLFSIDATTGQITVQQQPQTGYTLTLQSAIVPRVFSASGAPTTALS